MFENFAITNKLGFGLDIGNNSIKVVELESRGFYYRLKNYNEVPIVDGTIQKNSIESKKEVIEAITKAVKSAKPRPISTNKVISAIPENLVYSKIFKMPHMKKHELEKAIPYTVADFFPLPISEMYLDWHIFDFDSRTLSKDQKEDIEVFVVGVPKTLVNDYMLVTKSAGLDLVSLETKPMASVRAILSGKIPDAVALIDLGLKSSSISIIYKGIIRVTGTIKIGSDNITMDLAKILNISYEDAERIKITKGFEVEKKGKKEQIIVNNLKPILEETDETIKYFQTRVVKDAKIAKIFLIGGGSALLNLVPYIQKYLRTPTIIGNPWNRVVIPNNIKITDINLQKYTAAVGLAMKKI